MTFCFIYEPGKCYEAEIYMTTCYTSVRSRKKQNGQEPEQRHKDYGGKMSWFILVVTPTFACLKLRKP